VKTISNGNAYEIHVRLKHVTSVCRPRDLSINSTAPRLRACEVVSSPEWDVLSDHNPVVAWFEEGPSSP
jgi:hypothetical protein